MGLVRGVPADWSMQEFVETLEIPEGIGIVLKARRLNRKTNSDGQINWIPTQTVVLTFQGQTLPERIFSCHSSLRVETYQLPTIQCLNCCRFGHVKSQCRSKPRCFRCTLAHPGDDCNIPEIESLCLFCTASHYATNKACPEHNRQKNIKSCMSQESISYLEASARFRPISGKTFADSVKTTPSPSFNVSQPIIIPSQVSRQTTSYRKTVFLPPRSRPTSGKSFDKAAHEAITSNFPSSLPNGCAVSSPTLINNEVSPNENLLDCLWAVICNMLSKYDDIPIPIRSKKSELTFLINKFAPSILAISETWLLPGSRFRVSGYRCLRDDRDDGYAGCAFLVSRSLTFHSLSLPHCDGINAVAMRAFNISFISVYIPHPHIDLISDIRSIILSVPPPVVMLGDFNAHHVSWGCHSSDSFGSLLLDLLDDINISVLNNGCPTRRSLPSQNPANAVDLSLCSPDLSLFYPGVFLRALVGVTTSPF
ncbi:unnamed protein product [Pieris macdunnoughi]|uniref:Endonuclease/exonuclease/phosphatase domain-containing protein n=1 Tax=Pieris macdunnoughi TaxID=345717 RepID=A0A821W418_9NEOP|nr:unnamed protein product [Pieris macdunnoughi]